MLLVDIFIKCFTKSVRLKSQQQQQQQHNSNNSNNSNNITSTSSSRRRIKERLQVKSDKAEEGNTLSSIESKETENISAGEKDE